MADEGFKRKLTAILSADAVEYSAIRRWTKLSIDQHFVGFDGGHRLCSSHGGARNVP